MRLKQPAREQLQLALLSMLLLLALNMLICFSHWLSVATVATKRMQESRRAPANADFRAGFRRCCTMSLHCGQGCLLLLEAAKQHEQL
jgi:hypothetical protein